MRFRQRRCITLHLFRKIIRKYSKRVARKNPKLLWQVWVYYYLSYADLVRFAEGKERLWDCKKLQLICQEVLDNRLKEYIIDGRPYLLTGVYITNEDYYYVLYSCDDQDIDEKRYSCVGGLEMII